MSIKRSPGCTCCQTCNVVAYQDLNYNLQANTLYALPGNINTFNRLELSNLLPAGFFKSKDDWFEIVPTDTNGNAISVIRFQLISLGHSYLYNWNDSTLPYPTIDKWRGLGAQFGGDWFLVRPTIYPKNVGSKELAITAVSDGTFDGEPCIVSSLKSSFLYRLEQKQSNPGRTVAWEKKACLDEIDAGYAFSKNRHEIFDNESSFPTEFNRFNNTTQQTDFTIRFNFPGVTPLDDFITLNSGDSIYSISETLAGLTTGTGSIALYNAANTSPIASYNAGSFISVNDSSAQNGPGEFKIECTRAYVYENESVDIRIVRTGGNSDAVDVTLYNDGTYQTVSFAAGDNYKTVTVSGQQHDGLRSSLDLHSDDTPPTPADDYGLDYIIIRDVSQELGGDPNGWISQQHSTTRSFYFWYKGSVPFDYSLGDNNATIKVRSSKDVTLGYYGVSKVRNDATCDYTEEHEKTCPIHQTCGYNSDFNHQPLDFYDDSGVNSLYLPTEEKHVFVDGCETWHLFRGPGFQFDEPYFVYRNNYRVDDYLVQTDQANPGIYIIPEYSPPADTSTGPYTTTCAGTTVSYNVTNRYSDIPSGYVYIGSTGFVQALSCGSYTGGEELNLYYANYTSEIPIYVSNLTATRTSECDDWSFLYGDTVASYTDITGNTSPLTEVIAKVTVDVFQQADWYDPPDTTDTSFEFVLTGHPLKGAVYRWNGTDYDMIGQERIYIAAFDSSSAELSNQIYIDRVTEPWWFYKDGNYYYLQPNSGADLTVRGPFAAPINNSVTPAIQVEYAGRKRIRLNMDFQGATSETTYDFGGVYVSDGSDEFLDPWKAIYTADSLTGTDIPISVAMGSGTATGSNLYWSKLLKWDDPYGVCGNTINVSTYSISMRDSYDYPIWANETFGTCFTTGDRFGTGSTDCSCFDTEWSLNNTPTDRNEAFNVPSSAESCDWYNCVPALNAYYEDFPHSVGPDQLNAHAYASLPSVTSQVVNMTVGIGTGGICDCYTGNTSSGQVTQKYLDFTSETVWPGTLARLSGGSTGAVIRAFDYETIMPAITKSGYHENPFFARFESLSTGEDVNDYTNYTSCWTDYNFPGIAFSESNLDSPMDSNLDPSNSLVTYSNYYSNRQLRFISGYNIPSPTLQDYHDPTGLQALQSSCGYVPCVDQWRFDNLYHSFVDIHPRYLSLYVDKFSPTWPK